MNFAIHRFIAIIFAACFLALQLHHYDVEESGQGHNETAVYSKFNVDENVALFSNGHYVLPSAFFKDSHVSQQKVTLSQQRQYLADIEQQTPHLFWQNMRQCITALKRGIERQINVFYKQQTRLNLSIEWVSVFIRKTLIHQPEKPSS